MISNKKRISIWQKLWVGLGLGLFALPSFADPYAYIQGVGQAAIITQDVGIALGLCLFIGGIFKLKKYGESRTFMSSQLSIARPLAMLVGGVALLCLPVMTSTLMTAFWGYSNPLSYPMAGNPEAQQIINGVVLTIRLVGVIGIMRGIVLMTRAGGEQAQPGTIGKAVLHMLGGLMCLHIMNVWYILDKLLSFGNTG